MRALTFMAVVLGVQAVGSSQETRPVGPITAERIDITVGQPTAGEIVEEQRERTPLFIRVYLQECERQRQLRIRGVWTSNLTGEQKQAAVSELNSKPYYAVMNVDVPPPEGAMGVLPPQVKATVVAIIDNYDMLVDLSWLNERFQTPYGRKVWVKGLPTSGLQVGSEVPMRGVLRVSGRKQNLTVKDNAAEVAVVEVIDLSRFMDEAFERLKYEHLRQDGDKLHQEKLLRDASEANADGCLRIGKSYLRDGYPKLAQPYFQRVVDEYANSEAAKEARELLGKIAQAPGKEQK